MRKRKKIDSSTIVLSSIIVIFTIIIFLSLPVLFNYKSIQNEIENKFFSDFKINLKILDNISFRVLPRPHLLIKKANLDFNIENEKSAIAEVRNLKLFIPSNKIYSKKNIVITDMKFENANLNIKINDLKDFRDHLYFKINKPITATNIKVFLSDSENNVILISPIKKINYQINENFTAKELKLKGSIFDIDFTSYWKRNYNEPKSTLNEIKLKNPNVFIKNLFIYENQNEFRGSSSIKFLNESILFDYFFKNSKIKVSSPDQKNNQSIKLNSSIELNPFYFNGEITFEKKNISFISDYILNFITNAEREFLENLDGDLILTLSNLEDKLLKNGKISLSINQGKIKNLNSYLEMDEIGVVKTNYIYTIKEGELIFKTKNVLNVTNQKKLAQKFQLNIKKIENIKKVFFDLDRNIDTGDVYLSNIHINEKDSQNLLEEIVKINNMIVLKSTLRDILP